MLNPQHVATFLALVATRSFHEAARRRGISQAAVSQHIRKLEERLGVRVIDRDLAGCELTPEGTAFLPFAQSLTRLHERALAAVRDRQVTVGASSNIGTYLLQPYVKAFLARTDHRIEVTIGANPQIAERLENGELDVALLEWWDERPGCEARPWRDEEVVVIAPPDHDWQARSSVTRELLRAAPLLGGEPGTGTGRLLDHYFGDDAQHIRVVRRLGSTEAVKRWVRAGLGVSLVLAGTVEEERADGSLLVLPFEGEPPRKRLHVAWRGGLLPQSGALRFVEQLFA
ncbi:MAG: LysR family transcriptional regulator [Ectothiorhodospiraceae bacterium]|jgi:DNA-binding transcriptional LysR family regulator|nr:LysR family transcriptional regulator [Ectothiorhodospiraceae bacterium]